MSFEKVGVQPPREGWVRTLRAWFPPYSHRHAELELNLVRSGRARFLMEQGDYELTPRTLIFLFPAQEHVLVDRSDDFEVWVAVFSRPLARRIAEDASYAILSKRHPPGRFCRRLSAEDYLQLEHHFQGFHGDANDVTRYNLGLSYGLALAWRRFQQTQEDSVVSRDLHPGVLKAAALLQREDAPDTLDGLAEEVGMSPSYVSRLFHRQVGVKIADYRNEQRFQHYLKLRDEHPEYTMRACALEAGFGSYAQFHRVLKARTKPAPPLQL